MSGHESVRVENTEDVLRVFDQRILEQRLDMGRGLIRDDVDVDQITGALEHQAGVAARVREDFRAWVEALFARLRAEGDDHRG
jgi:hypothetical protein